MRASHQTDATFATEGPIGPLELAGLIAAVLARASPDRPAAASVFTQDGLANHWIDEHIPDEAKASVSALVESARPICTEGRGRSEMFVSVTPEASATLRAADAAWLGGLEGALAKRIARLGPASREALPRYPLPNPHDLPPNQSGDVLEAIGKCLGGKAPTQERAGAEGPKCADPLPAQAAGQCTQDGISLEAGASPVRIGFGKPSQ